MSDARAIAEETARASYGRLLAWLSSRTKDVSAAEDALADAFRAALETWPEKGVPDAPEAWLITAAKRKLIDQSRRSKTRSDALPALTLAAEDAEAAANTEEAFPDERLKLLFICAHPAIDSSIRTPLMLQTVLGLDAAKIASAFLLSPSAMSGRLVRAKRKMKTAGIPFETPNVEELPDRLAAVLNAIYAAFGTGWDDHDGAEAGIHDLTREAIYLARLVTKLMPEEAEAWGLLALMLHAEARKGARRVNGAYVPLKEQDPQRWDQSLFEAGEKALAVAWRFQKVGRFQIEAAIQSAHAAGVRQKRDTSKDVAALYGQLVQISPSVGAQVGCAAALGETGQYELAIKTLNAVQESHAERYQPYWAVRAHILKKAGAIAEAVSCYERAIGLCSDDAARKFLIEKKNACAQSTKNKN